MFHCHAILKISKYLICAYYTSNDVILIYMTILIKISCDSRSIRQRKKKDENKRKCTLNNKKKYF